MNVKKIALMTGNIFLQVRCAQMFGFNKTESVVSADHLKIYILSINDHVIFLAFNLKRIEVVSDM